MNRKAKTWINKGAGLFDAGQFTDAIQCLDKALEIEPRSAPAWANKGACLASMGRFDEAKQCFDKALEIDPLEASAWINEGGVFTDLGQFQEAIQCYDRALEIDQKRTDVWVKKGLCFNKLRIFNEAIRCFDKALEIDPKDAEAWSTKGESLESLGQQEEALKCYAKALDIISQNWIDKGSMLFDAGRFEEAIDCYAKAFETSEKTALDWFDKWLDEGNLRKILETVDSKIIGQTIEVLNIAGSFRYYHKTSLTIIRLATRLTGKREVASFESFRNAVDSIYSTFRDEYVEADTFGRDYRIKCFDEVQMILTRSINNLGERTSTMIDELLRIRSRMLEIDERLRSLENTGADLLVKTDRSIADSMNLFHSVCYGYLIVVEALFNDVIRVLFLFSEASRGRILKFEEIKMASVWEIRGVYKQVFGICPVFLEGSRLQKIKDIRDAIAHAQATFNPEADQVHFWLIKTKEHPRIFDITMSFKEFFTVHFEVLDLIGSLRRSIDIMLVEALLIASFKSS